VTGTDLRIGIIHARWNNEIVDALVAGAKKSLQAADVKTENVVVQNVPGSWELPMGVQRCV
jgi:6,7-dimethyl-8-ribityllumazine synthase